VGKLILEHVRANRTAASCYKSIKLWSSLKMVMGDRWRSFFREKRSPPLKSWCLFSGNCDPIYWKFDVRSQMLRGRWLNLHTSLMPTIHTWSSVGLKDEHFCRRHRDFSLLSTFWIYEGSIVVDRPFNLRNIPNVDDREKYPDIKS
jgi:hypothetical protein